MSSQIAGEPVLSAHYANEIILTHRQEVSRMMKITQCG